MSEELKDRAKQARKAQKRCNAFKVMAILSGAIAIVLGTLAAIMPPPWRVDPSILQLIGEFMGIQALFEAMAAFESGRDAKIVHGNTTVALDGNGDGKVE